MQIISKILQAITRNTALTYGFEQEPTYVTTGDPYIAATGSCYYMAQALGEEATITTAKDLAGDTITALSGAKIAAGRILLGRFSSLEFTAPSAQCTVVLSSRIITDTVYQLP